ncbi:MAG: PP0621 family protein [Variovorax sp.]
MKYLLVLAVVWIAFWLWRQRRRAEIDAHRAAQHAAHAKTSSAAPVAAPQPMAQCDYCQVHLPLADALDGRQGRYCTVAHQQAAEG